MLIAFSKIIRRFIIINCCALSFVSCSPDSTTLKSEIHAEIESTLPFSSSQLSVTYAKGFNIEYEEELCIISTYHLTGLSVDTFRYILAPKTLDVPTKYQELPIIRTPVSRLITTSTTQIAMVEFLEGLDHLIGATDSEYIVSSAVKTAIQKGQIISLGSSQQLDLEGIIALNPDLLMLSNVSEEKSGILQRLRDAGIPIMINSEWKESSLLGRAEWSKILGLLFHKGDLAQKKFAEVAQSYQELAGKVANKDSKPLCIWGLPYKDVWYVGGGNSYVANLLEDAGAEWNWADDTSSVSIPLDLETVYPVGLQADYWFNIGTVNNASELLSVDDRFEQFGPVKKGRLFNNTAQLGETGLGNAYWESGVVQPHLILADIVHILHEDMLPNHQLVYYKQLE